MDTDWRKDKGSTDCIFVLFYRVLCIKSSTFSRMEYSTAVILLYAFVSCRYIYCYIIVLIAIMDVYEISHMHQSDDNDSERWNELKQIKNLVFVSCFKQNVGHTEL